MTQCAHSQQGTILLEALISAGLLLVTAVSVITFTHRALKGNQILNGLLDPQCEIPRCERNGTTSACTCGKHSFLILN